VKPEELLSQITPKYGVDDVQSDAVETVSVLDFEELESLIAKAVEARTKSLLDELATARKELNDLAANSGDGLEAEAAEAALEAEARALEAKADAEQLAAAAQSKVAQLEAQLRDLENEEPGGADPAALEAAQAKTTAAEEAQQVAEAKAAELQTKVDDLQGRLEAAEAKAAEAEAKATEAATAAPAAAAEEDDEPAAPVTEKDLKHASRLAEAFLEEVFMDDESKSNAAIKKGDAEEVFKKEIASAYKQYVKRVSAAVRADSSAWDNVLQDCLKREW
jgi:DNA repair exonuclease SbcCD ATPase subunit